MDNKKILFINHDCLKDPEMFDCVIAHSQYPDSDWKKFLKLQKFNSGTPGSYVRAGTNVFPVKNDLITELGWQCPDYDPEFSKPFADITDQRCQDLRTTYDQKPWLILWSGGIDSTVVVASILKNFAPQELSRIKIACNKLSVYENPHFFYKYIEPNFELINSSNLTLNNELFKNHVVIDGEPADQLFASRMQDLLFQHPACLTKNIRTDPDQLLQFLSTGTSDSIVPLGGKWADWFYGTMMTNIDSQDIPVVDYHDFYWWYMFNITWAGIKIRNLHFHSDSTAESLQVYLNNFVHWFDTVDYQRWAMTNNKIGIKYGTNIAEYKLVAKQYIYDFDHNEWYYKFKTKKNSISRIPDKPIWDCILNDFTWLNLKAHRQEILNLLPSHVT